MGCGGDDAGDCNLCPSGEFKVKGITGGNYTDKCQSCTACPLGKERGDASDPCVRTGGGSTSDTGTCTGCNAGFYQDVAPTARNNLYPSNPLLDKCEACEECLPGGSRAGCGNADAGICAPWETPTITGVSGSGKDGGSTTGTMNRWVLLLCLGLVVVWWWWWLGVVRVCIRLILLTFLSRCATVPRSMRHCSSVLRQPTFDH